jgi:Bacteriocin-protection, YdeI or OmpD-Associated/Domain of unknown function (DUF1905)
MDQPYVFAARIQKIWIMRCVDLPREVCKSFRQLAGADAKHIPVRGWIEGLPMQSTLVPAGAGRYRLHVHSRIWRKLRIDAGAIVEITLLLDTEPRDPALPPDLAAGLAETPRALASFNAQTPAMRRQIVQFLEAAKRDATREKRVQQIAKLMLARAAKQRKTRTKVKAKRTQAAR